MEKVNERRRKQEHTAYWYAKKYGRAFGDWAMRGRWTTCLAGILYPGPTGGGTMVCDWSPWDGGGRGFRATRMGRYLIQTSRPVHGIYGAFYFSERRFDPAVFMFHAALDLGDLMREGMRRLTDPEERGTFKDMVRQNLRKVRRPFYYARERERRRELRRERRKIHRRTTTASMPAPADILNAWSRRRESKANMIRLGGLLHDLECYVDNSLVFNENGRIIRRRGGIRGWLKENLPELVPHYKAVMSYKAMAMKLRQATETVDPQPTVELLEEGRPEIVVKILAQPEETLVSILRVLDDYLSPERVFLEERRRRRRSLRETQRVVRDG